MIREQAKAIPSGQNAVLRNLFHVGVAVAAVAWWSTPVAAADDDAVLESAELIEQHGVAWLTNLGIPGVEYAVSVYKLTYWTPNLQGVQALASAAFVMPQLECEAPLVAFIHGTTYLKTAAPSAWNEDTGSEIQGYSFGAYGMACVMPDLLGLGDSPGHHPYLNAAANARTTIDAIRAAREFQLQQGLPLHSQLFLMGSSAGAHTALATNRMILEEYADEFTVAATGGVSGPYAIHPVLRDIMLAEEPNNGGADLVYMLMGYHAAYPGLFASYSSFLVSPYNVILPPLYNGSYDIEDIYPLLPPVPADMFPLALRQQLATQPNAPLNVKMRLNNVFNWVPQAPVRLCYCSSDPLVPPENSQIAYDSLSANSSLVNLLDLSTTASHALCGRLGRINITNWFRTLGVECSGTVGIAAPGTSAPDLFISPNPVASGDIEVQVTGLAANKSGMARIQIVDGQGRNVMDRSDPFSRGELREVLDLDEDLAPGVYSLIVTLPKVRLVEQVVLTL